MNDITTNILDWHKQINRDLPWKNTDDPYFIWLSEIILQQTRVAQGTPYYLKFIELFPSVHDLARASQEEVFKAWEGLGYYSRARNLHAAAKFISEELDGQFPNRYESILQLKGVGPYTAAAIASFAFGEDRAVLDGNVFRVLARLFDIDLDILSTPGKKMFSKIAQELLPSGHAAAYNQAIMDFGALQCTPQKPNCMFCTLQEHCEAFQHGTIDQRPVKKKAAKKRKRYFHFLDTSASGILCIEKRQDKDVWEGLFQFPLVETKGSAPLDITAWNIKTLNQNDHPIQLKVEIKQTLSHQIIYGSFYQFVGKPDAETIQQMLITEGNIQCISMQELDQYGLPRLINRYLGR